MMLLNPSAGEIVDRLTILELKIGHSGKRDTTEWLHEHLILKNKLEFMVVSTRDNYVANGLREYYDSLQAVNRQLWDAEDELRTYPDEGEWHTTEILAIAKCAKKIALFNDKRMGLVREINTLFNQTYAAQGAQKIYSAVKS